MTAEHGPLAEDESKREIGWHISGMMVSSVVQVFRLRTNSIRYDRHKNRISLHGESQNPGSPYKAGVIAALVPLSAFMMYIGVAAMFWQLPNALSSYSEVLSGAVGGLYLGIVITLVTCTIPLLERIKQMSVVDHTTEPLPDDLDDLKQQFVDGDLDDSEFEAQLEDRLTEVEC